MKKKILIVILPIFVLVGAHYALTLLDEVLKVGRMWETPGVRPHEQPLEVMEKGLVPFSGGEALYRAAAADALESPLTGGPADIELGQKGYFTYCAQCHGKYHDGNGTVGQSFSPLPGDLRSAKVQSLSPGAMFKEISYGIPGGRQPPLDTTVEITDRWRIVAYVKSLGVRK
jgi:mono/diheme cytochrome c family protein